MSCKYYRRFGTYRFITKSTYWCRNCLDRFIPYCIDGKAKYKLPFIIFSWILLSSNYTIYFRIQIHKNQYNWTLQEPSNFSTEFWNKNAIWYVSAIWNHGVSGRRKRRDSCLRQCRSWWRSRGWQPKKICRKNSNFEYQRGRRNVRVRKDNVRVCSS